MECRRRRDARAGVSLAASSPTGASPMARPYDFARQLAQGFLHIIYPPVCAACSQPLASGAEHFCSSCRAALTADPLPSCPRCASTVGPFVDVRDGCGNCRSQSFHFERAIRLGPYDGLLRELILRMKHASGELLSELLAAVWAEHAEA